MTEEMDFYETLAKLRDFHNGIAEALDAFIQQKSKVVLKEYDPEKIKWEDKEGIKGPYQSTDDADNLEYKALRKDLADHKGFIMYKGFQYWVFQNGTTIGRRKKA
jgi:hypothetical protein